MEKYFNPKNAAKQIVEILKKALLESEAQTAHRSAHSYYLQKLDALQQELLSTQQKLLSTVQQEQQLAKNLEMIKNQHNPVPAQVLGKWITNKNGGNRFEKLPPPFQQQDRLCWLFNFPTPGLNGDSSSSPHKSNLLLYEEDRLLGPAHSEHEEIRSQGGGRYSHWETALYFSTSDGSDPNTNGRRYTVIWP